MKRCPECRRDYYDDTLLYCLDDGNPLLEGPATASGSVPPAVAGGDFSSDDEHATAILHSTAAPGEAPTRAQINTTDQTAVLRAGAEAEPLSDHAASIEARARSTELVDRPDLASRLRETFRERGWRAYLQELFDQTAELFPNLIRRASILCELGKPDEAIILLEQSAAKGEWWLFIIKQDPQFDVLRDNPRFQALVKQFDPPK